MARKRPVITSPNIYQRGTPEATPNIQYPQNKLPSSQTPDNPLVTGPSLDDHVAHPWQDEIKHPKPPEIPTDDPNGFRPSLPPDQKPRTDRSNALAVDQPKRVRRLKNLHLDRVDLVTAGANQGAHVVLHKMEDDPDTFMSMDSPGVNMSDELATEEVEKQEESPEPKRVRQISKAQEKLEKALADERARSEALAERVEKMENERLEAEYVAKAQQLPNLGNARELGRLMLDVQKSVKPETYQSLERLFKAANAQLEKGDLFATLGRAEGEPATAMDRITELAKAKVANGLAKTIEIAKMDVIRENPELRDEYLRSDY